MKKLYMLLMCMVMSCMVTMKVSATESVIASGTCGEELTWELVDDTLTISGNGEMKDYNIWKEGIVEESPWAEYRTAIEKVVIEDGVLSIGSYAFSDCYYLKTVELPESLIEIGSSAFCNSGISEISLPDSVKKISGAFYWCTQLKSIHIPASVSSISSDTFEGCLRMETITVAPENEYYCAEDNVLFRKNKDVLIFCVPTKEGKYVIPDTVFFIDYNAFWNCTELNDVFIPEGVTYIGEEAFVYSGITKISIPPSVVSIGDYAFYGTDITEITIPATVTTIGDYALGYKGGLVENFVIRGYAGTVAEEYAINNNIAFVDLTNATSTLEINLSLPVLSDTNDDVVVKLIGEDGEIETTVSEDGTSCQFSDISAGSYTLEIAKKNYVTRTYTVDVGTGKMEQEVELQLIGDITNDGAINARDKKLIYNHMAGTSTLTDYIFLVGDVTNDGTINARDKKLIYNHIAGASSLWE